LSLYRETGRSGRQGLIAGAVALVIGLGVGYLLGHANAEEPSFGEAVAALRADLGPVANGLELLGGEYPQGVSGGEIVAQTEYDGSVSNVERIRDVLAANAGELEQLDPEATAELTDVVDQLGEAVAAQAPPAEVDRLRQDAIAALRAILPTESP
jgi:hypothetical protein